MEVKTDLFGGDCREILKNIPDNSVDLIFTSPPYADQKKYLWRDTSKSWTQLEQMTEVNRNSLGNKEK